MTSIEYECRWSVPLNAIEVKMRAKQFKRNLKSFVANKRGEFAMQSALMFGALAVAGALLAAPLLDKASKEFAYYQPLGIDPITTASTGSGNSKPKKYVVRRSVLNGNEIVRCKSSVGASC